MRKCQLVDLCNTFLLQFIYILVENENNELSMLPLKTIQSTILNIRPANKAGQPTKDTWYFCKIFKLNKNKKNLFAFVKNK